MREKKRHTSGSRGFTALEVVVTVVVLAILAAYATPKLFGLKDRAKETEETMKIQDLESRHAKAMLEQGKRNGSLPTLGGTVGFRSPVVSEEAPDELPVLYSYSYWMLIPRDPRSSTEVFSPNLLGYRPLTSPPFGSGVNWQDPNGDGVSGCEELVSGIIDSRFVKIDTTSYALLTGISVARAGDDYQKSHTEPVPSCIIQSVSYRRWCTTGTTCKNDETDIPSAAASLGFSKTLTTVSSFDTDHSYQRRLSPAFYRYSCAGHSERYGVEYALPANMSLDAPRPLNRTRTMVSSSPVYYEQSYDPVYPPAPVANAKCVRQGPAPEPAPSDPGDTGAYPMAADGSGYCLSPGRKLPTYKDGAGTPTSSPSAPVAELGSEAVDDPTNCPG